MGNRNTNPNKWEWLEYFAPPGHVYTMYTPRGTHRGYDEPIKSIRIEAVRQIINGTTTSELSRDTVMRAYAR